MRSYKELLLLSNSLVGDEMTKVEMLLSPKQMIIEEMGRYNSTEPLEIQNLKLDILYTILLMNKPIREKFNEAYMAAVKQIYSSDLLANNLNMVDPMTNLKYLRLINLCVTNCAVLEFPFTSSLVDNFSYLTNTSFKDNEYTATDAHILIELLKYFLRNIEIIKGKRLLKESLEFIIVSYFDKYSHFISMKYQLHYKNSHTNSHKVSILQKNKSGHKNIGLNSLTCLPDVINITDSVDRELLLLSLASYYVVLEGPNELFIEDSLFNNIHITIFASGLMKSSYIPMKCASLNFVMAPLFYFKRSQRKKRRLRQLLPFLIETFNIQPLPSWFDPFDLLYRLLKLYSTVNPTNNPVTNYLSDTNLINGILNLFAQCLSLEKQTTASLKTVNNLIKICAVVSAYDDQYRSLLLEEPLILNHLEHGLRFHITLQEQFLSHKRLIRDMAADIFIEDCELPAFHDSELTYSWLILLKSLSRSIITARSSLKRTELADILFTMLQNTYKITKDCYFAGKAFIESEISIMSLTLGTISNIVVEFSNLQSFMLKHGIVDIIGEILTDPIFNDKRQITNSQRSKIFAEISTNDVKTYALWVLRHLMYNSETPEKLELISKIDMSTILEFVNDKHWLVQGQCFQLIKNLTCNSRKVINILLDNFREEASNFEVELANPRESIYLFEYLAHKMLSLNVKDNLQRNILESTMYIIVNIAAINENKKQLVVNQNEILEIIHHILSEDAENHEHYGNDSDLKLAGLWILNNLLWNSEIPRHTYYALESSSFSKNERTEDGMENEQEGEGEGEKSPNHSNTASNLSEMIRQHQEINLAGDDINNDNNTSEFTHSGGTVESAKFNNGNAAVVERCHKLVDLGFYDLVKKNIYDDSISVKEKSKTLLYHMDFLLKDSA